MSGDFSPSQSSHLLFVFVFPVNTQNCQIVILFKWPITDQLSQGQLGVLTRSALPRLVLELLDVAVLWRLLPVLPVLAADPVKLIKDLVCQ